MGRDGAATVINDTDAHIIVFDLGLGSPLKVADLPPYTSTPYPSSSCSGPVELRTDDGRLVKRVDRLCKGRLAVRLTQADLTRSPP